MVFCVAVCIVFVSLFTIPIIFLFLSFALISFVESRRKKKYKLLKNTTMDNHNNISQKKNSKFKNTFLNFYEGLYRMIVFLLSRVPSHLFRIFAYKFIFKMNIKKKVVIHKGLEIRCGYNITIGEGTIIGDDCILDGRGTIYIGSNCNFSSRVSVYTNQHNVDDTLFGGESSPVNICDRAWISANAVVLPGVNVGEGAVLAAGGVATKDLESFSVYGGVPAKKIKNRNNSLSYCFDGKTNWFN